jgi:hypothetical protein
LLFLYLSFDLAHFSFHKRIFLYRGRTVAEQQGNSQFYLKSLKYQKREDKDWGYVGKRNGINVERKVVSEGNQNKS